jgi:hypothetical protein
MIIVRDNLNKINNPQFWEALVDMNPNKKEKEEFYKVFYWLNSSKIKIIAEEVV